jgi:hypothetical protein
MGPEALYRFLKFLTINSQSIGIFSKKKYKIKVTGLLEFYLFKK